MADHTPRLSAGGFGWKDGEELRLAIRPEDLQVATSMGGSAFHGTVDIVMDLGPFRPGGVAVGQSNSTQGFRLQRASRRGWRRGCAWPLPAVWPMSVTPNRSSADFAVPGDRPVSAANPPCAAPTRRVPAPILVVAWVEINELQANDHSSVSPIAAPRRWSRRIRSAPLRRRCVSGWRW